MSCREAITRAQAQHVLADHHDGHEDQHDKAGEQNELQAQRRAVCIAVAADQQTVLDDAHSGDLLADLIHQVTALVGLHPGGGRLNVARLAHSDAGDQLGAARRDRQAQPLERHKLAGVADHHFQLGEGRRQRVG
jgi:hypothetical protein